MTHVVHSRAAGCAGPGRRGLYPRRPGLGSQPANDDPRTGFALEPQHCFNNQRRQGGSEHPPYSRALECARSACHGGLTRLIVHLTPQRREEARCPTTTSVSAVFSVGTIRNKWTST